MPGGAGGKGSMKAHLLVFTAVLCCACGSMPPKRALRHANNVGYGLMLGSIACDWGQTRHAAAAGWDKAGFVENNPMLGPTPSVGRVDLYMTAVLMGAVVVGRVLPDWAQPFVYVPVVSVQTKTIIGNHRAGVPGVCGQAFTGG